MTCFDGFDSETERSRLFLKETAHHKTPTSNVGDIEWLGIRFRFPSVKRFKLCPRRKDSSRVDRGDEGECVLDGTCVSPILHFFRDGSLDVEGVLFRIADAEVEFNAVVRRQVPDVTGRRGTLRREPGATECRGVQSTVKPNRL